MPGFTPEQLFQNFKTEYRNRVQAVADNEAYSDEMRAQHAAILIQVDSGELDQSLRDLFAVQNG